MGFLFTMEVKVVVLPPDLHATELSVRLNPVMTVCCQDVRAPCSLHLSSFSVHIRTLFSAINGSTVYAAGDFGVQYKVTPPSLHIIIIDSITEMLHWLTVLLCM